MLQGEYLFSLTTTDYKGFTNSDTVRIIVNPLSDNPVADAGEDIIINLPQATFTITGRGVGGVASPNPLYRFVGRKRYELKDHLGNVRVVISDAKNIDGSALLHSYASYFAFGAVLTNGTWNKDSYRYGYNGKEKDPEFQNNYDYGFRIYNANIAKFLSIDPLTDKYPQLTPYQFASNMPIQGVDLDGLEVYHYTLLYNKTGQPYLVFGGVQEREMSFWQTIRMAFTFKEYKNSELDGSKIEGVYYVISNKYGSALYP